MGRVLLFFVTKACGYVSRSLLLQIQRSQFIVVVGGGSAGVEMAAEIKTEYPEKEVRLDLLAMNSQQDKNPYVHLFV